jgi:hypothetical protein
MYAEPTIKDFEDNVRWHLDKVRQNKPNKYFMKFGNS